MTLRDLLLDIDTEDVAGKLADDLYRNVAVQYEINRDELKNIFNDAIIEMRNLQRSECSSGNELVVVKIFDYTVVEAEKFEVLIKMPDDGERYSIEMMPWEELIDLKISDLSLKKYNKDEVIITILRAMTFFGLSEALQRETVANNLKILKERDLQETTISGRTYTLGEVAKKLGLELPKETEAEKERRTKRMRELIIKNNKIYKEFGFTPIKIL